MNNNNELMIIKLLCFRTVRCFRIILYFSNIPWNYRNSMYIELPSHSLLQGGSVFFRQHFCDRVKIKKC